MKDAIKLIKKRKFLYLGSKIMSQKGFILRSILWGIFLGLVIVAGLLFYPDIRSLLKSSTPRIADKITTVKEKVVPKKFPVLQEKDELIQKPCDKKIMYAFFKFDERATAEDFMENIEKRSGVDLWLGQEDYRYVVYIPAADEQEKREKADLIKRETGITGK